MPGQELGNLGQRLLGLGVAIVILEDVPHTLPDTAFDVYADTSELAFQALAHGHQQVPRAGSDHHRRQAFERSKQR